MTRTFSIFALLCLGLVACGGASAPSPQVTDGKIAHPLEGEVPGLQRTLVARYHHVKESTDSEGQPRKEAQYGGVRYRPRQSEYAGYEGWDVLETPRSSSNAADWLHLSLNRDAQVVIVWENSASWLGGWQKGTTSLTENERTKDYLTYTKSVPKGDLVLGGPGEDNGRYTVLIAEKGGAVSEPPPLPSSERTLETPVPNAICPNWLHNAYQATGPDGAQYKTWHPQIDPVYWCYFGHEHGSDPSLIGYAAKLNYTATQNSSQAEQHQGFKGFAVRDEEQGLGWYLNVHATTSDIARVCVQFHTVVVAVTDLKTGELLAELSYKGDFGGVVANRKDNRDEVPAITPANCPEQADDGSRPVKRIRVANEASIDNGDYERWFGGITRELGMDFKGDFGLEIDIRNPGTSCNTFRCTGDFVNNSQGDRRTLRLKQITVKHNPFYGDGSGVFYTNPYGTLPANEGDPGAIRQYIKPGLDVTSPDAFFATQDAWRARYTQEHKVPGVELESSLRVN